MKSRKATFSLLPIPLAALLLIAGCGGGSDSEPASSTSADSASAPDSSSGHSDQDDTNQAKKTVKVPDACELIDHTELEQILGWELGNAESEEYPPGSFACDFDVVPGLYSTRKYPDPALPESIGFSSLVVNTYPSSAEQFDEFRQLLADAAEEVSGIGDGAYFYEFDMIYGRVGDKGFSMRIHTDAQTDEDRMLVREVMLTLARKAARNLN